MPQDSHKDNLFQQYKKANEYPDIQSNINSAALCDLNINIASNVNIKIYNDLHNVHHFATRKAH